MSALGSLVVKLALEHAEFTKGINKSDQAALKFAKNTQDKFDQVDRKTKQFFGNFAAGALGAIGSIAGISGAVNKFNSAIDTLADLSALSQRTGVAVETLSQLDRVIRDTGGSMEETVTGIDKLAQGMARVAGQSNRVLNALDAISVETRNMDGTLRDSGAVFIDVSKRLAEFEDGANKTTLVMDVFGRSGAKLLPVMNNVAARIDDTAQSSTAAALQAEAYNNAVGTLGRRFDDLFTNISAQVLPTMLRVVEAMSSSSTATGAFSQAGVVLSNVLKGLAVSATTIGGTFRLLGDQIGGRAAQLVALSNLDFKGAAKIGEELSLSFNRIKNEVGDTIDTILNADIELVEAIERTGKKQLEFTAGAVDGTDRLEKALKGVNKEAVKEVDTLNKLGRTLTLQLDPLTRYNDEVAELIQLLNAGAISQEIFDKALTNAKKRFDETGAAVDTVTEKLNETRETSRRVFDDVSQFALQGARNIQTALADALLDSTKGFESFASNVFTIFKRMAAEVASVRILEGLGVDRLFGATGGGGFSGFSGSGGGGGSFNASSLLKTGGNLLSSGFGLNAVLGSSISAAGSALGSGTLAAFGGGFSGGAAAGVSAGVLEGGMSAAAASGAAGMGASAAAIMGPAVIAFAATQILKGLAGDKRLGGGIGDAVNFVGDLPILGEFNVLAPILNGLFGRGPLKQKDSLIRGTVGAGGIGDDFLTATNFKAKGSLARGDKFDRVINSALTGQLITGAPGLPEAGISGKLLPFAEQAGAQALEIGKLFNEAIGAFSTNLRASAQDLNISTDALDRFNTWVQLTSEAGESITEQQVADVLADIGEQMAASLVPGLAALRKENESGIAAINRMAQEAQLLEGALVVLGISSANAENAINGLSLAAKTELVDATGGMDALGQKIGFFTTNFLTQAEQTALLFNSVDAELQKMGFSASITRDEFANLIKSVTEAGGISTEFAADLLTIAPVFDELKTKEDQLAAQTQETATELDGLTGSLSNLEAAANERGVLRNRLLNLQGDTGKLRDFEILATDESNRQLLGRIHALEDEKLAIDNVAEAVAGVSIAVNTQKQTLQDSLTQRGEESRSLIDGINLSIQAREDEKTAIRTSFDIAIKANADISATVAETVNRLQGLSNLINDAVKTIAPITKADAENQVIAAIAKAKGGDFIDADAIREAVERLTRQNENEFSSRLDMQRDAAKSKNLLNELGGLTNAQLSTEEKTLETLKDQAEALKTGFDRQIAQLDSLIEDGRAQIEREVQGMADLTAAVALEMERLDSITKFAESQYNELVGINGGIQTIAGAMSVLGTARQAANDAIVRTGDDSNVVPLPPRPAAPKRVSDQDIREFFSKGPSADEIATAAFANSVSSGRIKQVMNFTQATVDNFFRSNPDIPRFATGTSFVPETGPAIVHKGERIINPEQNRELITQLKNMNLALLQVIFNTGSANRVLKRWDGGGMPPERAA